MLNGTTYSNASDTVRRGPGTTLLMSKQVIYIWHVPRNNDMLVLAIGCIACVYCGSELDHVARVSEHMCGEVVF